MYLINRYIAILEYSNIMYSHDLSKGQRRETTSTFGKTEISNGFEPSGQTKSKSSGYLPSLTGAGLSAFKWIKKGNTVVVLNPLDNSLTTDAQVITGPSGKIIEFGYDKFNQKDAGNKMAFSIPAKIENRSINSQQIPVTSNVVDVVISSNAMTITANPLQLFKESFRILKPAGTIRFFELINAKEQDPRDSNGLNESLSSHQYLSPTNINKQLSQAGFNAIRISHSELLPALQPYFQGKMSEDKTAFRVLIVSAQKPANSLCNQPGCC